MATTMPSHLLIEHVASSHWLIHFCIDGFAPYHCCGRPFCFLAINNYNRSC
uniref:Uncharacterized protein n=1 Tax=Arundo donax TaxID=35708 RepID=A0A0A9A739_ARUDO